MRKYVIKLDEMYFGESGYSKRVIFSPMFEDATFFQSIDDAKKSFTDHNLPEHCKIKQVTYVEHDIGYVEHTPLAGKDMA